MRLLVLLCGFCIGLTAFAQTEVINNGRADVPLRLPAGYSPDKPLPLVMLLHGYTSSGAGQDQYMKFSELVDEYQFMLLLPDGTVEQAGDQNRFWNATAACCNFQNGTVDDSAYLHGLIETVATEYAVDRKRIYLIGHSNGGFMSHRLAQDHPETVAALVSLAGAAPLELNGPAFDTPVNVLQIHGSEDATIKYAGGVIRGNTYPSATGTAQRWARYTSGSATQRNLDTRLDLDRTLAGEETTISQFGEAGNVELWTINGGSHVPPLTANFNRSVIEWLFSHPKGNPGS